MTSPPTADFGPVLEQFLEKAFAEGRRFQRQRVDTRNAQLPEWDAMRAELAKAMIEAYEEAKEFQRRHEAAITDAVNEIADFGAGGR